MFQYTAPGNTVRNTIQYIAIEIEEGQYAGIKTGSCGDSLWGGDVDRVIMWAAKYNGPVGHTASKVSVCLGTGRPLEMQFDISGTDSLASLINQIDAKVFGS